MGDSGIDVQLSLLVLLLIFTAIVAFVAACRVRNRVVRVLVGIFLLATAAACSLFSAIAVLLVVALGFIALVLGIKTPKGNRPITETSRMRNEETERRSGDTPTRSASLSLDVSPSLHKKLERYRC